MALAADLTREEQRTKTMAIIGSSIGLMFALSLVGAPTLYRLIGMGGIFALTGFLALGAIFVLYQMVPPAPPLPQHLDEDFEAPTLAKIVRDPELLRLNFGIFVLHMVQMAMFVIVPRLLVEHAGLDVADHWMVYLPVVLASFVLMIPALMASERHGRAKRIFIGSIVLLLLVQLGYFLGAYSIGWQIGLLLVFFLGFNILEASLPSLISRVAPPAAKATALGVYNTTQSLGLFVGGALGGWLAKHYGPESVFLFGVIMLACWALIATGMKVPAPRRPARTTMAPTTGSEPL
jgi:predicted MFS family arabinose efflux permease